MNKSRKFEIVIVLVISGFGMIYSGHILDIWKSSHYIDENDELWILITPLLGLKGNLEMTLASRLATMAKIHGMKNPLKIGYKNLILTQIQGILLGLGASVLVGIFNMMSSVDTFVQMIQRCIRLAFIGVLTASTTSLVLGTVTMSIVYCSWKFNFDPDNVASPLAAALGDTVTLFILHFFSKMCQFGSDIHYLHIATLGLIFVVVLPLLLSKLKNKEDVHALKTCSYAVFPAMILSSLSGVVLKRFVYQVRYLATFQPLVNGVGGNVASILCSSMSTNCHKLKSDDGYTDTDLKTSCNSLQRFLTVITLINHAILLFIIYLLGLISLVSILQIIIPYFCAVLIQTTILLYISRYLVLLLWSHGIDPDNSSIPIATGLGDILGTSLLCIFLLVST